ncbi:MAG: DUF362 domain-containing protein [Planctomycetes bacterium]|nr:DUF362 domain-containing protein [Planctomycetota bacterium]
MPYNLKHESNQSVCIHRRQTGGHQQGISWLRWAVPLVGLGAFIWFLIRVIPKPSRAAYPCQRLAFPVASGFLVWLFGVAGAALAFRKARQSLLLSRYMVAGLCIVAAVCSIWFSLSIEGESASGAFVPSDGSNNSMGVAKGINPGRVVWSHNPWATSWDGDNGYWWEASHTNQDAVDLMLSKNLRELTSQSSDALAWDTLFKYYNQSKGNDDIGYQAGEQIAIKINMNNNGSGNAIDASPQMVLGILRQLVKHAEVDPSAITVYDATREISDSVYNTCYDEFPAVNYYSSSDITWAPDAIAYSAEITSSSARRVPECVINAEYMINMALLKRHDSHAAVTLCAKNHFGTIADPYSIHNYSHCWDRGMGSYDPQVDLIGYDHTGGKTILFIIDGLYGADSHYGDPKKWDLAPFNNDWPSSIFMSQDPVAIDSVGLDFLRAEFTLRDNADNYLHEASQADDPPSGVFYDPNDDGLGLASLGVHEHWNDATNKQYSRNLGTGNGIELVTQSFTRDISSDLNFDGKVNLEDYWLLTKYWNTQSDFADITGDGQIDTNDLRAFSEAWLSDIR